MKNRLQCAILIVVLGLLLFPFPSKAAIYLEKLERGKIDWSNGTVEAVGVSLPPRKAVNQAQARALALQQATRLARRNLIRIFRMIRIDSRHLGKDMWFHNGSPVRKINQLFSHAEMIDTCFLSGSRVRRRMTVCIRGPVADILLPGNVREIEHIKGGVPHKEAASPVPAGRRPFTGLVVDCRGLKVKPALVPRILDEDGNEVYGPAIVDRKYALKKGVAEYVKKLGDALGDPRVGGNPLRVKAVRATGSNSCDIVISNLDAGKVVAVPANLGFLEEANVIIVLD